MEVTVKWKEIIYDIDFSPMEIKEHRFLGVSYSIKLNGIDKLTISTVYDAYGNIVTNTRIKNIIIDKSTEWRKENKK